MGWEYKKINLNELARGDDAIDALCKAGQDEWELVAIVANNIAYLKRQIDDGPDPIAVEDVADEPTHEVKAKYRDPVTGDAWSGRGRMARWLKAKQDTGEDIEKYRV
jgi:H-NS histone family